MYRSNSLMKAKSNQTTAAINEKVEGSSRGMRSKQK